MLIGPLFGCKYTKESCDLCKTFKEIFWYYINYGIIYELIKNIFWLNINNISDDLLN